VVWTAGVAVGVAVTRVNVGCNTIRPGLTVCSAIGANVEADTDEAQNRITRKNVIPIRLRDSCGTGREREIIG
jgi:hypothetical protein